MPCIWKGLQGWKQRKKGIWERPSLIGRTLKRNQSTCMGDTWWIWNMAEKYQASGILGSHVPERMPQFKPLAYLSCWYPLFPTCRRCLLDPITMLSKGNACMSYRRWACESVYSGGTKANTCSRPCVFIGWVDTALRGRPKPQHCFRLGLWSILVPLRASPLMWQVNLTIMKGTANKCRRQRKIKKK